MSSKSRRKKESSDRRPKTSKELATDARRKFEQFLYVDTDKKQSRGQYKLDPEVQKMFRSGSFAVKDTSGKRIPILDARHVERIEKVKGPKAYRKILDRAIEDINFDRVGQRGSGVSFKKNELDHAKHKLARVEYMKDVVDEYEARKNAKYDPSKPSVDFKIREKLFGDDKVMRIVLALMLGVFVILMFRFLMWPLFSL